MFSDLAFSQPNHGVADQAAPCVSRSFFENECVWLSRAEGWVAGAQRGVEVYSFPDGFLLRVVEVGDFLLSQTGETITKRGASEAVTQLERETVLGPVLVFALALRGTWSFHASAARFQEKVIVFLGESGQGKSTLAAYLSRSPGWRSVADDILPVTIEPSGVTVWPHFPQLKLPAESQPWIGLPEQLSLGAVCVLEAAGPEQQPEIHKLSIPQAAQAFIGHIAGTRLFPPDLLKKHLEFSALAAAHVPAYRLVYPHSKDKLPAVRTLLEKIG